MRYVEGFQSSRNRNPEEVKLHHYFQTFESREQRMKSVIRGGLNLVVQVRETKACLPKSVERPAQMPRFLAS
jgi:hypothetical protein